jgi:protein-L-isoaspartate(D-aspartate) O-methyltransferase
MDFKLARHNMVECQVRPNQVTDSGIIEAMSEIPREAFVPEAMAEVAYVDQALEVGHGRFLLAPMVLARLLQEAELTRNDMVLLVGCGTGYATAVISQIAGTVVALEQEAALAESATRLLASLEIDNAAVVEGPLVAGWKDQAPYDVIIFGGGAAEIPDAITAQLTEAGRLVAVKADQGGIGRGTLVTNFNGVGTAREFMDAAAPLLPGFERAAEFSF